MKSHLKEYRFTIKTKAPVFIGSGQIAGKKEYIFDRKENMIYFMDTYRFFSALAEHGMTEDYQKFMMNFSKKDLYSFLDNNRLLEKAKREWTSYKAEVVDKNLINRAHSDVSLFIKDPYGKPYIPGSSFKGALRTILQVKYFLDHPEEKQQFARQLLDRLKNRDQKNIRGIAGMEKQLSIKAFHDMIFEEVSIEDVRNDLMRGIIVSDSDPIDKKLLCICQKWDQSVNGRMSSPDLLRECICPDVEVSFNITIDKSFCSFTIKDIISAVESFFTLYKQEFLNCFSEAPPARGNPTTFFLGGGTGYVSKTVIYSLLFGKTGQKAVGHILDSRYKGHRHCEDHKIGASPHTLKCTIYRGHPYQMGVCILRKIEPSNRS